MKKRVLILCLTLAALNNLEAKNDTHLQTHPQSSPKKNTSVSEKKQTSTTPTGVQPARTSSTPPATSSSTGSQSTQTQGQSASGQTSDRKHLREIRRASLAAQGAAAVHGTSSPQTQQALNNLDKTLAANPSTTQGS